MQSINYSNTVVHFDISGGKMNDNKTKYTNEKLREIYPVLSSGSTDRVGTPLSSPMISFASESLL